MFGFVILDLQQNKTISTKPPLIKSGEIRHALRIRWVISELANTRFVLEKLNILTKIVRILLVAETKKL